MVLQIMESYIIGTIVGTYVGNKYVKINNA